MIHPVELFLDILQTELILRTLLSGVLLNLLRLIDTIYDSSPGCFQRFDPNGVSRRKLRSHLRLFHGIARISDKHLIGLFIQRGHGFRLDPLPFQHDGLCQRLLENRKRDDKGGIDLAHQVHIAEFHGFDHGDGLHGHVFCDP